MMILAFLLTAVVLLAVWTDPDKMGDRSHRGSDSRRARLLVIGLSWCFVACAGYVVAHGHPLPGWLVVATAATWLIPGIWAMERQDTLGKAMYALLMGAPAICCASIVCGARLLLSARP